MSTWTWHLIRTASSRATKSVGPILSRHKLSQAKQSGDCKGEEGGQAKG